jgi:hypothetical protein
MTRSHVIRLTDKIERLHGHHRTPLSSFWLVTGPAAALFDKSIQAGDKLTRPGFAQKEGDGAARCHKAYSNLAVVLKQVQRANPNIVDGGEVKRTHGVDVALLPFYLVWQQPQVLSAFDRFTEFAHG